MDHPSIAKSSSVPRRGTIWVTMPSVKRSSPTRKATPPDARVPLLSEPLPRWAPAVSLAGVVLVMLVWTWGRWPDLLIDFSRDLYTSSQLAEGKVLYRDIAFFTGCGPQKFRADRGAALRRLCHIVLGHAS